MNHRLGLAAIAVVSLSFVTGLGALAACSDDAAVPSAAVDAAPPADAAVDTAPPRDASVEGDAPAMCDLGAVPSPCRG